MQVWRPRRCASRRSAVASSLLPISCSPLALYSALRPLLFRLDAEDAHTLGVRAALAGQAVPGVVRALVGSEADARLGETVWGLRFRSPLGLAAGFDKDARLVRFWDALGFGWADVGSVTNEASAGNVRPRAFRLADDEALVNRMGLNNGGAQAAARRLAEARPSGFVVSVNVTKTHRAEGAQLLGADGVEDVRRTAARMMPLADLMTLNVSCPNTADGKTFETPPALDALLAAVVPERDGYARDTLRRVPLLVKLSPDVVGLPELVSVALGHDVDGFVATNTASTRDGLRTGASALGQIGRGGISGRPLAARSLALTRELYRLTDARIPIVGVGGIDSAGEAYARVRAGASLVQLYTALVFKGPGVVREITRGLIARLDGDGFGGIAEAVGVDA